MPMLNDLQQELANLRAEGDAAATEARTLKFRAQVLRTRLARLQRSAPPEGDQLAGLAHEIADLDAAANAARERSRVIDDAMRDRAIDLLQVPVDDLVAQLDDHRPVLLFPVRLETKFAQGQHGVELRVRIFPDDIQVSTHDPALTAAERDAGDAYWVARATALGLAPDARRVAEQGAWTLLATRFGGPRARYVARTAKPAGWPVIAPPPGAGAGAPPEPTRDALTGVPPRARLLPDFFVVTALDAAGNVIAQGRGKSIPDTLQLGPDPESPAASLARDASGRLVADDKLAWLIDYNRAVDAGMAVTIGLPARMPIARVIAIGLRFSLSPDAGATAVEQLLSEHRFTRGIDIIKQGSPTNNTDDTPSVFTTDLSADEALVEQEVNGRVAMPVLDHADKSDSQRLAEALGIGFEAIRDWPNADATDIAQALAMNRALWPATMGTFLKEMVATRLSEPVKAAIERFFLTYVCGRSLLPAIRVGAQPYGVLVTSNLRTWSLGDDDREDATGMVTIVDGLRWFRARFEALEPSIAQVGRGADPLAMTMRVVGQLASSVTFASRKAVTDEVSWNTLQFEDTIPLVLVNWYQRLTDAKNNALGALGINRTGLPLGDLTFFPSPDSLAGVPVIDRDPEVPLSERETIAPFDGVRNYINWLLTASTADLRAELFKNGDGVVIPAPKALLYRLLHYAWSAQLVNVSRGLLTRLRPDLVVAVASPSIVNVGANKVLPDAFASDVSTLAIGLTQNTNLLGDYVLDLARVGDAVALDGTPEALPLQSQRDALSRLASLPTAVLERLFAEHLDLASYRLDAWQTGLMARRLDLMRRHRQRDRGIYIGAYGFVEDLQPKPAAMPVDQTTLPESLRSPKPVTEQTGNGGFVHAPSLTHAVTASVLRNAYLTHAEPTLREAMSVNLTSRRVRVAMGFVEGMRAGQELAALLGYQLERGLHERYPGTELDEFIYTLRARFPLVSRRLTPVPEGTPAEQIEARNVVDGYDLIEHVRGSTPYPYGIVGLPAAGTKEANAIIDEIALLEDSMDAVADLLTAESVHQAVQSNIDRARGALASVTAGEMPPVPDVVQTPRSGRVFIERVAVHLPTAALGWTNPPTPRAKTNPRLNRWLASQLPAPNTIGVAVIPSAGAVGTLTLDQTGLDAIDVVLMCGDHFGRGASELERALADVWRDLNGVGDDVVTLYATPAPGPDLPANFIVIDTSSAGGATIAVATLLPQLRALRHLVSTGRGLHAQDYQLPSESESDTVVRENPKGFALDGGGDFMTLPARVQDAHDDLDALNTTLQTVITGLEANYKAVVANPSAFNVATWTAPLTALRSTLRSIGLHGAPEAVPRSASGVTASAGVALYEQGVAVQAAIATRLDLATEALKPLPVEPPLPDPKQEARRRAGRLDRRLANLIDAARQSLGAGYPLQAVFRITDAAARIEIEASLAAPAESHPLAIEAWLQSLARVRTHVADLALCCAAAQWTIGSEPDLLPVQLPHRPGDPWIGGSWPAASAPPRGEMLSVMTVDAPVLFSGDLEGLFLDDWTETVPTTKETTGITFNFDRPNAAAPQALLIAAPPQADGRWQWQELLGTVQDTFDRARLRAIEPDDLQTSLFQILPMTLMPFTEIHGLATVFLTRDVLQTGVITG